MKKIISLLLSLVMVMSLSVTAFAADTNIESNEEGSNSASTPVTANYTPASAKAEITNLTVSGGASYDSSTNTYTVTPDGTKITITVTGTNFENLTTNNEVSYATGCGSFVLADYGWTIDTANNTASETFDNSTFQNCTTPFEIKYSNDGGKNWNPSGVKIIYKTEFISVNVAWGAMSFTYNDADEANSVAEGWTCAEGANQITVTNKGEVTVDAAVKYEAAADYTAITGTFDSGSATLAQNENKIFTLFLSGKPESALNDATIGTATVTITKSSD